MKKFFSGVTLLATLMLAAGPLLLTGCSETAETEIESQDPMADEEALEEYDEALQESSEGEAP